MRRRLHTDPNLTATGAIAGTPAYLAPEQLTGDPIDDRVDQFAWAVMAWELIAGSRPFPIVFALRVDAVRAGVTPPPTMDRRVADRADPRAAGRAARSLRLDARADRGAARAAPIAASERARAPVFVALGALVLGGAAVTILADPAAGDAWSRPVCLRIRARARARIRSASDRESDSGSDSVAVAGAGADSDRDAGRGRADPEIAEADREARDRAETAGRARCRRRAGGRDARVSTAIAMPRVRPLRRENAIATMIAFCRIPTDPAHLEPGWHGSGIADWGKVTSVATERGQFDGDPIVSPIVTVAGHRDHYRIETEIGVMGDAASQRRRRRRAVHVTARRRTSITIPAARSFR